MQEKIAYFEKISKDFIVQKEFPELEIIQDYNTLIKNTI